MVFYRLNEKKLGRILLDALYDKFVEEEKKVLLLEPANDQLTNYYQKWKQPNLDNPELLTYSYTGSTSPKSKSKSKTKKKPKQNPKRKLDRLLFLN
jgi:hypothetical protein